MRPKTGARHLMDLRIAEAMLKKFQEKYPKFKGSAVLQPAAAVFLWVK